MDRRTVRKAGILEVFRRLVAMHPGARVVLDHANAFQLLCAVVVSPQTTDVAVNRATPKLFARFPDAHALAVAELREIETLVGTLGYFRMKAKALLGLGKALVERHGGEVPRTMAELVALPGVGRKTANVVLSVAFGTVDGIVVDAHVKRVVTRLGWSDETDAGKVEAALCEVLPRAEWERASHVLTVHGRRVCHAKAPRCGECDVRDVCPSAVR